MIENTGTLGLGVNSQNTGYVVEGNFVDTTIQLGLLDTPKTILFGEDKDSDGLHVSMSNGEFTVNTSDYYVIKSRIRAVRSGSSGTSSMFFWTELSVDGGSNWAVLGNSIDISLETSNSQQILFDSSQLYLTAGLKLRTRFARSSLEANDGDLSPSNPSPTLISLGVQPAASAQITVYKLL